jgi:hypothetical protein
VSSSVLRLLLPVFASVCLVVASPAWAQLSGTAVNAYTDGYFTTSQLHAFGAPVSASVLAGSSYVGVSSQVTGVVPGATPSGTTTYRLFVPSAYHQPSSVPDYLGSTMIIRDGVNATGATATVSMAWRTRTDIEFNSVGYPCMLDGMQQPPVAYDTYSLTSDVVDLTGVSGAYVLQMSYSPDAFVWEKSWVTELFLTQIDRVYLGWFEDEAHAAGGYLPTREWVHATEGNVGAGAHVYTNYQGSFDDFIAAYPDFTPDGYLGSYGVSYADKTVWAVINHNSEFAATPEPATAVLLGLGAAAVLFRARMRWSRRANRG